MIKFTVYGIPKPQARPRLVRNRNFAYSPKTDWYYKVLNEAKKHKPLIQIDKPVSLTTYFHLPKPKSLKKNILFHTKRPDLDNLEKAVMDAITNAGIWTDDSLVCNKFSRKTYSDNPGIEISIEEIEDEHI